MELELEAFYNLYWLCYVMSRWIKELLNEEDFRKLEELRDMLEEIIETINLLLDPEALEGLREAEEDVKEGRVRSWDEFLKELKKT